MAVTELGIVSVVRLLFWKAYSSIKVRLFGRVKLEIELLKKASLPIVCTPSGNTTDVSPLKRNASSPIAVTLDPPIEAGISTSFGQAGLTELLPS